jgi:hypothetical protein
MVFYFVRWLRRCLQALRHPLPAREIPREGNPAWEPRRRLRWRRGRGWHEVARRGPRDASTAPGACACAPRPPLGGRVAGGGGCSRGLRRWECYLHLHWPRLRLMASSDIHRKVSRGGNWELVGRGGPRGRRWPGCLRPHRGRGLPPAPLEAWLGLGARPPASFFFPPVGWSSTRFLFLALTFPLMCTRAEGYGGLLPWDLRGFLGVREPRFLELETGVVRTSSVSSRRGPGAFRTHSGEQAFVGRIPRFEHMSNAFGDPGAQPPKDQPEGLAR